MIDKTQIVRSNKTMRYITYAVVLTFVLFNYKTVLSSIGYILSLAAPFYIAIVIAFILNIPMKKIEKLYSKKIKKKGLLRGMALFTTLILAILIIILFSSFIIPRLGESISLIITNIFSYANRLVTMVNNTLAHFHINYAINYQTIQESLSHLDLANILTKSSGAGITLLFQSFGIFSIFVNAITSFIMALYLLANKETHIRQLKKLITFIFGYRESLVMFDIGAEANHYFNGFVSGQLLECCILMGLMYGGFKITGIPFPELLAFIIGIASLVPMFGGYFGFAVSFILVLAVDSTQAIIFTICFVIIQQFEANVIYPRVVGGYVGISGLYVLLSLVIFGNLLGFFGLLIAVPSMALIYAVGSRIVNITLYRHRIEITDTSIHKIKDVDQDIPHNYRGH